MTGRSGEGAREPPPPVRLSLCIPMPVACGRPSDLSPLDPTPSGFLSRKHFSCLLLCTLWLGLLSVEWTEPWDILCGGGPGVHHDVEAGHSTMVLV